MANSTSKILLWIATPIIINVPIIDWMFSVVPVRHRVTSTPEIPSGTASTEGYSEGASPSYVSDFLATSEGLALTRAFTRITDAKLRRSIVELVEQIASREAPDKR